MLKLGSCGLILWKHIVHRSFQIGLKKTEWDRDQVLKAIWKLYLIALHEGKYICELVKLIFSLWVNSLPKFCFWFIINLADTRLSTPTTGLHPMIMATSPTCSQLLWNKYSAVYFALQFMKPPIKLILAGQFFLWLKCFLTIKFYLMNNFWKFWVGPRRGVSVTCEKWVFRICWVK